MDATTSATPSAAGRKPRSFIHHALAAISLMLLTAGINTFGQSSDATGVDTTNLTAGGHRNVAACTEPGVQVAVSSHSFRNGGMVHDGAPCPINRPFNHDLPGSNCWVTSEYEHLPHWVWFHFASPRRIDQVVLRAASMETRPLDFAGQNLAGSGDTFNTIFKTQNAAFDPQTLAYTNHFPPIVTSDFRLLIDRNAATTTPQSWVIQLAQVEVYGTDATNAAPPAASASHRPPTRLDSGLRATKFFPTERGTSQGIEVSTPWYRLVLDESHPRIQQLSWDSIGQGELNVNLLQPSGACPVLSPVFDSPTELPASSLSHSRNIYRYDPVEIAPGVYEQVSIRMNERGFDLELAAVADHSVLMRGGLFRFHFAANQTPTTFVCRPSALLNYVDLPAYLDAPDFGTAYITRTGDDAAFYRKPSALFPATTYWEDITPGQPRTADGLNELGTTPWRTTLHFELKQLEPLPNLTEKETRLPRLPKYSLNMIQWRPDTGINGNSVMSVDCGLAVLFYAEQSMFVPRLENGISPMAMIGASVDRYFQGAPGYQMPSRNVCAPDWWSSRETPAYLVISAWEVIRTVGGMAQLHQWQDSLDCLANRLESQIESDGLIHHHGRGNMWFDTYNMQEGPDAYSNAADYRAFQCMADLETLAGHRDLAKRYQVDADRIAAVYLKSFYNPATGVLAGWRSDDGQLHDYMFPWVNGFAICQGLVPDDQARSILRVMLAKLKSIGFHSYQLGLPTNLKPFSPADYIPHTSGAPKRADGTDTWQVYMNGGANPAIEYYFIQALYRTGQYDEAEQLLWPLMESFEKGTFNAGIQLPKEKQRNPVGSAFYRWDGSHGAGEGYLPEDWDGVEALYTGHYGIGFDQDGYYLEPWSPLKGKKVRLDLPYMGKNISYVTRSK